MDEQFRNICGLALSNSTCASAVGLASQMIDLCHERFENTDDRQLFQRIVTLSQQKFAWPIRDSSVSL